MVGKTQLLVSEGLKLGMNEDNDSNSGHVDHVFLSPGVSWKIWELLSYLFICSDTGDCDSIYRFVSYKCSLIT